MLKVKCLISLSHESLRLLSVIINYKTASHYFPQAKLQYSLCHGTRLYVLVLHFEIEIEHSTGRQMIVLVDVA